MKELTVLATILLKHTKVIDEYQNVIVTLKEFMRMMNYSDPNYAEEKFRKAAHDLFDTDYKMSLYKDDYRVHGRFIMELRVDDKEFADRVIFTVTGHGYYPLAYLVKKILPHWEKINAL